MKINSKLIIELNIQPVSIKLLEDNMGDNGCEIEIGRFFRYDTKNMVCEMCN